MAESSVHSADASGRLDYSMARAVAWSAGARWVSQILSWASTIVVARLLTPYDYGLAGMAGLYLLLATLIGQTGVSDAIIALRDLTDRQIAELNTIAVLIGIGLVAVSCTVAPALALFFSAPPLRDIVMVASIGYVLNGFQIVPRALLKKDLRFKRLASIDSARVFCQAALTVLLALMHLRYWSLVIGTAAGFACAMVLTLSCSKHAFAIPRFARLRRELRFGRHTLTGALAWYAYDNADFAVAGRLLGSDALGNYTIAWTIASAPVEKIATLITGVMPAFLSAVQTSKADLRRYFLNLSEILSYVTVPASVGIALTSDYLIPVVLGAKWQMAIGPLRLLGLFIAVRCLAEIPLKMLNAIGDTRFAMWATIAAAVLMPASFVIGSHWGITGIAAGWLAGYPLVAAPIFYRAFRKTETRIKQYLLAVTPAITASLVMAGSILLLRFSVQTDYHPVVYLSGLVATGVVSYVCALFLFFRGRVLRLISFAKRLRRKVRSDETKTPSQEPEFVR